MIRPLTNQALIEVLPNETQTHSGLFIPDQAKAGERGEKKAPFKGLVVAVGKWKTTRLGFSVLPEIQPGQKVLCSAYSGQALTRNIGERYRLVRVDDVLAVIDP